MHLNLPGASTNAPVWKLRYGLCIQSHPGGLIVEQQKTTTKTDCLIVDNDKSITNIKKPYEPPRVVALSIDATEAATGIGVDAAIFS